MKADNEGERMKVAVAGAGTMGAGIAQACAAAGHEVLLFDVSEEARTRGMTAVKASLARVVKKGALSEDGKAAALSNITLIGDLDQFKKVDLVIEAIFENLSAKRELWGKVDKVAKDTTTLASNTSSLSITELASFVSKPERFCGFALFQPGAGLAPRRGRARAAHRRRDRSKNDALCRRVGQTPIVCADKPGFIVNRLLVPYMNDAVHALGEGVASAEDIDKAMKLGANMPIGPLALADLVGLDVALAAGESLYNEFQDSKFRVAPLVRQMVRAGKLGRKTGEGFYKYEQ